MERCHDRIVSSTRLETDDVVPGSHQLRYTASYAWNLLIIRGNQELAAAYTTQLPVAGIRFGNDTARSGQVSR